MSWSFWPLNKSRKKNVVGITSRAPESNFSWLKLFVRNECSDLFEMKYLPITNKNRWKWEEEVGTCSAIILYHTSLMGRINVTDIDSALYDSELRYLSSILGREKVVVLLDDMDDISEDNRQIILRTQKSLDLLSSHLILIPEKNKSEVAKRKLREFRTALSEGATTSHQKESSRLFSYITSKIPTSSGDTEHSDSKTEDKGKLARFNSIIAKSSELMNPSQPPPGPYRIGIFSRSVETNYTWLADSLKTDDSMRSLDIKSVYISNNYKTFRSQLETCQFAILYHSQKQGRLNITNVTDSLYDIELMDMSTVLGRENVIVVADDLKSNEPEDKEQILTHQPRIHTYAKELFLFTEEAKCTRNLEKIKEMIQKCQAKHNSPGIEDQAAPPREMESSMENPGYPVDGHEDRITPDQGPARDSSPSCSESVGLQTTSQKSNIVEPQYKRPKTVLGSEQTDSIELKHDLTGDGDVENSDIINIGKGECARDTTDITYHRSPPPPYQISIFSRSAESNYSWLISSLKADNHMRSLDIKSVCITNDYTKFRSGLQTCRFAILYHTKNQGRMNITDVADSLYNEELRDMSKILGKENVIVVADDLKRSEPEDKKQILKYQPSIHTYAKDLFLFTEEEKCTRSLETIKEIIQTSVRRSQWEGSTGGISITSTGSRSSGDAEHEDTEDNRRGERRRPPAAGSTSGNPSQSPRPPYRIAIFSRCAESNYTWLADGLKADGGMRSLDIKVVYITNDDKTFRSGLKTCRFGILYHTQKYGRLNIANVANSLYDDELRSMSDFLRRENVIVVADDLKSSKPEDKERILTEQPRIHTYANDLFLFTEEEKCTRNLETIRQIIRRSQAKHNGPGTEYQAAPPRERESSMKIQEYYVDGHKNKITPDQVSTKNSSPSCSGSVGGQITSQKRDTAEPQCKRSKTLSSEQTNSMDTECDLPDAPSLDLLSAPNKKWNDSQQDNQEPRKVVLSQEEKTKELENSLNSLTLEKNRAVEQMKKIIQKEERNIDGDGEEIGERKNLLQQRQTNGKEIEMCALPLEGEEGARGHETVPQGRERFPEKGHHLKEPLQKTEGSSCLENQSMDELITKIQEIINEKDRKLQRQSEEIKNFEYFLSEFKWQKY